MRVPGILLLVLASPALVAAEAPFGPRVYHRGTAAPVTVEEAFEVCDVAGPFRLVVENGIDGQPRVSSASIVLNGSEVVRERDLDQQVARIDRAVALQPVNRLLVRLAGAPDGAIRVGVEGDPRCLSAAILEPAPGAAVPAGRLVVRGTVRGAPEVGVTVNGVVAAVHGEEFAALVPVAPGETGRADLVVVASRPDGRTAEARSFVAVTPPDAAGIRLFATPASGPPPLAVRFTLLSTLATDQAVLDPGDGTGPRPAPDLEAGEYTYPAPGAYVAAVTVPGPGGPYRAPVLIDVWDPALLAGLLPAKWAAMKDALRRGDVAGALAFVAASRRARYDTLLRGLTRPLADIDAILTDLQYVGDAGNRVEYQMIRTDDEGDPVSYPVFFVKDEDGIWRLEFF